jgi:3-oxoacyl-[acyl-carrier protein] reductase
MPERYGNGSSEKSIARLGNQIASININLSAKTALITGATRGIGRAIADVFIEAGANVILTGTNQSKIDKLNSENENKAIKWIMADFSTLDRINLFTNGLKYMNPIDICVNNAGINIIKPFDEVSHKEYDELMSVNLSAPYRIVQCLIPNMKKQNYGRIVNIASIWSQVSKSGRSLYITSKTGLAGFTRSMAAENAVDNILVNAVSPGFTLTELTRQSLSNNEMKELSRQIPMGRFAEPNEIAKTVLFLCSDLNTYITGQNITVDGGFTIV